MKNYSYLIVFFFPTILLAFSGKGIGSKEDPYQITNVQQLQEMKDELDAHYILMNDIDASETREWNVGDHDDNPETPDSAMGFEPIGLYDYDNSDIVFSGSIDGKEHKISNLYINRINGSIDKSTATKIGLFGYISNGSKIVNIRIENCDISGGNTVGSLCGVNGGYINNCSITGNISGIVKVGGLVGNSSGSIRNCNTKVVVSGIERVGGLCGNNMGFIKNSFSISNVLGEKRIGGICGFSCVYSPSYFPHILISSCYSKCKVEGKYLVGGFCGLNLSYIKDCYSDSEITAKFSSGGFVGDNDKSDWGDEGGKIENCYSTSTLIGDGHYGGFCGKNDYEIDNCYYDNQKIEYYDPIVLGKTTAQMMRQSTFVDWDFDEVWCMVEGKTYPHLQAIEDCDNLVSVKYISQNNDISVFPNPFSQSTTITYELQEAGHISLELFDMLGNEVAVLVDGWQEAGKHQAVFNVGNTHAVFNVGNTHACSLPAGMYLLKMTTSDGVVTEKVVYVE